MKLLRLEIERIIGDFGRVLYVELLFGIFLGHNLFGEIILYLILSKSLV